MAAQGDKVVWTEKKTVELISAVEQKRVLWDIGSTEYKIRSSRETAWEEVADKIGVSKAEANDKWRLLRQQFRNAFAKTKKNRNGKISKNVKSPNEYFSAMLFMEPVLTMQADRRELYRTSSTPSTASTSYTEVNTSTRQRKHPVQEIHFTPSRSSSPEPAVKRPRNSIAERVYPEATARPTDAKDESPEQIWARYMVSVMTSHKNPNAVRRFKFKVNRLLEELEMGEFDREEVPVHTTIIMRSPKIESDSSFEEAYYS